MHIFLRIITAVSTLPAIIFFFYFIVLAFDETREGGASYLLYAVLSLIVPVVLGILARLTYRDRKK